MKMLDTNIIIYMLRHRPDYLYERFIDESTQGLCISAITLAELRYGIERSTRPAENESVLMYILSYLKIRPFDLASAYEYGKIHSDLYKRGYNIDQMDMLIAATSIVNGLTLVTDNTKHFSHIPNLTIENWIERDRDK